MKRNMSIIIGLIILITIIGLPRLFLDNNEDIPEVKLKAQEKNKSLAIMVTSEDGKGYQEYEGNEWPKDEEDYYYNHAECIDNSGKKIDEAITFNEEKNTVTLNTNKTIYCTLYFDKYNYMRVITKQVSIGSSNTDVPVYMSSKIKHIYFVDHIDLDNATNHWDISDTSKGTKEGSVVAWTEAISNDTGYDNLYIGSKNIIRATSLERVFKAAQYDGAYENSISNLESIDFNDRLDTSKTTNLNVLFAGNKLLTKINGMKNWDVSLVTSTYQMFYNCSSLTNIDDLKNWNVSSLTTMSEMFLNCTNLSNINAIESWDVKNVIYMNSLFANCKNLKEINLSNWHPTILKSINHMFSGCINVTKITGIKDWNVSTIANMQAVFAGCSNLDSVDISGWHTESATNMSFMFNICSKLTKIDMRNATFNKVTNYGSMFYNVPITTNLIIKSDQENWIKNTAEYKGNIQKI